MRNAGGTILGADNKSAVAVMLEAARRIVEESAAARGDRAAVHAEGGDRAARRDRVRRRRGSRPARVRLRPGGADRRGDPRRADARRSSSSRSTAAPRTRGCTRRRAARRSSAAARAIADMRLGRIDELTTRERRPDRGGTARNIVPERCASRRRCGRTTTARHRARPADRSTQPPSRQRSGLRGRDEDRAEVPRLPVPRRRPRGSDRGRGARAGRLRAAATRSRAARATRTSSTRAGCRASTSRTGCSTSTRRTSGSRSTTWSAMVDVTLALVDAAADAAADAAQPSLGHGDRRPRAAGCARAAARSTASRASPTRG